MWHGIAEGATYERLGTGDSLRRDQLTSLLDRAILTAGVQLPDPAERPFTVVRGVHADAIGRLAEVVFVDFESVDRWGMLVVHAEHAEDIARAFGDLHDRDVPIARIEPIERYGGDDSASMDANNTSAFNCRFVSGTSRFSEHAYGGAIDINPTQNPYVRGNTALPSEGRAYLDRDDVRAGMLVRPGTVEAFDDIGWGCGGDWNTLKDYQHVSLTDRCPRRRSAQEPAASAITSGTPSSTRRPQT